VLLTPALVIAVVGMPWMLLRFLLTRVAGRADVAHPDRGRPSGGPPQQLDKLVTVTSDHGVGQWCGEDQGLDHELAEQLTEATPVDAT
jgi:hypothetical protein